MLILAPPQEPVLSSTAGERLTGFCPMNPKYIEKARTIAAQTHASEKRHATNAPYILHPWRMVEWLRKVGWLSNERECIAWLHDVLESGYDLSTLRNDFPAEIVWPVIALSNLPGKHKSYEDYILFVRQSGPDAIAIKIADLTDNLSDAPSPRQIERYAKALGVLWDSL